LVQSNKEAALPQMYLIKLLDFYDQMMQMINTEKVVALTKGAIKKLVVKRAQDARTYGTDNSRYCYSVWLRHLSYAGKMGFNHVDKVVAELGPGESIGIGLAALLTGCKKYHALDVHQYWDTKKNLMIFDKLVDLFKNRTDIPDNHEFPKVYPLLDHYGFPYHILKDDLMKKMLSEDRIAKLRSEIRNMDSMKGDQIEFYVPWETTAKIQHGSLDYIYSQAVLQYVDDLDRTYGRMNNLLKQGGMMSHCIDFSSHGLTKSWNGHWIFSDAEWRFVHGNKKIILNREPKSSHVDINDKQGFEILVMKDTKKQIGYTQKQFHKKYKTLSDQDTQTSVSFILSKKIKDTTNSVSEDLHKVVGNSLFD
jgi:SAM-dependent methyltransferase